MHPNPHFREPDSAFHRALVDEIGFGMVFCQTSDGPRVAHTPLIAGQGDTVRFHLARGNALTRHLAAQRALLVVNGADAYISARWYSDPDQVPTWNYVAAEMEGPVRELDRDGLVALLTDLSHRHESRITHGKRWTMDKMSDRHREGLLKAIVGFEMTVEHWRETVKLSQNKPAEVRDEVISGLEQQGDHAMARAMREHSA